MVASLKAGTKKIERFQQIIERRKALEVENEKLKGEIRALTEKQPTATRIHPDDINLIADRVADKLLGRSLEQIDIQREVAMTPEQRKELSSQRVKVARKGIKK